MQKGITAFFTFLILSFLMPAAYGAAILQIVPNTLQVTVVSGQTELVDYTVTNNTNSLVGGITIDPAYSIAAATAIITLETNNCNILFPGQSCTFSLGLQDSGQSGSFVLSPLVCAFSGSACSVPVLANRTQVTTDATPILTHVSYISQKGTYDLQCSVTSGVFSSCAPSSDAPLFDNADTIFNSSSTLAYLIGALGDINTCAVNNQVIDATSCQLSSEPTLNPVGAAINAGYLYITDTSNDQVASCPITGATIGACSFITDVAIVNPTGRISFKNTGSATLAYIASASNSLIQCEVNGSGLFINCTTLNDAAFTFTISTQINAAGNLLYVSNATTIAICELDSSGGIVSCSVVSDPSFAAIFNFFVDSNYLYSGNVGPNNLLSCPIIGNTLGSCTTSPGPTDQPISMWVVQ